MFYAFNLNIKNHGKRSEPDDHSVTVITHPTISLVKYFGVRCEKFRLPSRSSFALSLAALSTTTTVSFNIEPQIDYVVIEGYDEDQGIEKVRAFIEKFRQKTGVREYFNVHSKNNFPTASGLASSGSGYAALSIALAELCKLELSKTALSKLARLGSGSAVRSIYGGMILWHRGNHVEGDDCFAETVFPTSEEMGQALFLVITSSPKAGSFQYDAMSIMA